jgi:phospholipid/cholesterol/gamma-HCH transport system substrate-binding protein
MERNPHYFIVGLFVSIGIAVMIAFILWLAGTHDMRRYDHYTIYFTDAVAGLNEGASVQYKGVQVGKVRDIRIGEGRNDLVKVDIEVRQGTPVHATTTASLATLGVTGLVFIQLTTMAGDNDEPIRIKGEPYPVIRGSGSGISKILKDVPKINRQIIEITTRINDMLTPDNIAKINQILSNVDALTGNLNAFLGSDNVTNASIALKNISTASAGFAPMVERMNHTADQLDKTVTKLNALIGDNRQNIDAFTDQGLRQITDATREAKDAARSIRELSDKLKQDPSQILYKPNYQGVKVPQ